MTSDKADRSEARELLDYALGKKRVSLKELKPEEFDDLLRGTLYDVDLRELRGFKPLKEFLARNSGGNFVVGQVPNPSENVNCHVELAIRPTNQGAGSFTFQTHVVSVCRGVLSQDTIYRKYESGEETNDWKVAHNWSHPGGYIKSIRQRVLVLRRPNDHTRADENLFELDYQIEKVPDKHEMQIVSLNVSFVSNFRAHFGNKYASVGQYVIWQISSLSRSTLSALKSQVEYFDAQVGLLEKLSNSIIE